MTDEPTESLPALLTAPPNSGPKTSVVEDLEHLEYIDIPGLGSSYAKAMLRSPMHARFEAAKPRDDSKRFFDWGTAVHLGLLEPERWEVDIVEMPPYNLRKKQDKADREIFIEQAIAANPNAVILTPTEKNHAEIAIARAANHSGVIELLDDPDMKTELSIFWEDAKFKVHCKARFDIYRSDNRVVDVKTCQDASEAGFERAINNFGYHIQAGHYDNGSEHVFDQSLKAWYFIAIENTPPFGVATYRLLPDAWARGKHLADRATEIYAECIDRNYWPGYSEKIEPISIPGWALKDRNIRMVAR